MRLVLIVSLLTMLVGCAQPGTPILRHRIRGLPEGFPPDIPLHVDFSVVKTGGLPHRSEDGRFFVVKFTTDMEPHEVHYFFRKQLTGRGYRIVQESGNTRGRGIIVFENQKHHIEVSIGTERATSTILLRLRTKNTEEKK